MRHGAGLEAGYCSSPASAGVTTPSLRTNKQAAKPLSEPHVIIADFLPSALLHHRKRIP
jgi:hypothetical protein